MKIVINNSYGGFGLSEIAIDRLKELKNDKDFNFYNLERHDPSLVQVVEEMGVECWGCFSELIIEEIDDNLTYIISEYDGLESLNVYVPITIDELKNGLSEQKMDMVKSHRMIKLVN